LRAWEPYTSGIQLADENLTNRPQRFVTDARRLDDPPGSASVVIRSKGHPRGPRSRARET
jgi:hypothetical protein